MTPVLTASEFFDYLLAGDALSLRGQMDHPNLDLSGLRGLCDAHGNIFDAFATNSLERLSLWRESNTPDEAYSPVYRLDVLDFILKHHLAQVTPQAFLQHVLRGIDPDFDAVSPQEDATVVRMFDCAFNKHTYNISAPTPQEWITAYEHIAWGYFNGFIDYTLTCGWFDFMLHDVTATDIHASLLKKQGFELKDFLPQWVVDSMPWHGSSSIPGVFKTFERVMEIHPELLSDTLRTDIPQIVCDMISNKWASGVARKLLTHIDPTYGNQMFVDHINSMKFHTQHMSEGQEGVLFAVLRQRPYLLAERSAYAPEGQEWSLYDLFTKGSVFFNSWRNPDDTYEHDCVNTIEELENARQKRVLMEHVTNRGVRSKTARI